ncbi:hypothetical protein [Mesobacterium pallidum]|uniref:hypothetical protein n=1 Tax=Mesobacterium pallidum TaxID=2872037 RepID=UPI001EE2D2B7|nr:hypothetical protein [Mesobacterium pallidum]
MRLLPALAIGLAMLPRMGATEAVDAKAYLACIAGGEALQSCLAVAHAACDAIPAETPAAAIACYRAAEQGWTDAIKSTLQSRAETMAPDALTALSINTRYDLMTALLQCDRRQEIGLAVTQDPAPEIQAARARCGALSAALVLARLGAAP